MELSKDKYRGNLNQIRVVSHNNVIFNILGNISIIEVSTNEDYIASVFDFLKSNSIHYYNMKPMAQRLLKFVIKGLPTYFDINEIKISIPLKSLLF